MIRSIGYTIVVICSVLWLPWWAGAIFFFLGVAVLQYPFLLIVPAFVSDYVFASHTGGFFSNHLVLTLVAGLLIVRYSVLATTRLGTLYKNNDIPSAKKTGSF